MQGDTKQHLTLSILHHIYDQPLTQFTIPFSAENLKRVEMVSNLHSNLWQNIVSYTHNNFEISIWADAPVEAKSFLFELEFLSAGQIEPIFLLVMTLYRLSAELGADFIDFSVFGPGPANTVRFPIALVEKPGKEPPLNRLLEIFQKNSHFNDLNEKNHQEIVDRLRSKIIFDEEQVYCFKYEDFAAAILNNYLLAESSTQVKVKIKINTTHPTQARIIKMHLTSHHSSGEIFFANPGNPSDNLPGAVARLLPMTGTPADPGEDFVSIIQELNVFLGKSTFTAMVLMIDRLRTREDAEFILYLMESAGVANRVLICFDSTCDLIDFDLEFNEKPENLLRRSLRFADAEMKESTSLNPEEVKLLKLFHTLPGPCSREQLQPLLSPAQSVVIDNLTRKNLLKVSCGKVLLNRSFAYPNLQITPREEQAILEPLLKTGAGASLSVKLKYFLLSGQTGRLRETLTQQLRERSDLAADVAGIKRILAENDLFLRNHIDVVELLAALLLKVNEPQLAREVISNYAGTNLSAVLKLKLAHIHKGEKAYGKMERLLSVIEAETEFKGERELQDEYHYLRFVYYRKRSEDKPADKHLKKIKGELFRQRSALLLSDRHLYRGEYKEAKILLDKAIDYFHRQGWQADEIEAKSQLAKLLREKQDFPEAKKMYKNLFIKSEMKNYRLLAADISVDLGNLYWFQDKFNSAETWYKKALKLFQKLENQNGIFLVKSNLVLLNKIKGNWQDVKKDLEAILAYDQQNNAVNSMGVDYFSIGHLEYLKHRFATAREFVETARSFFEKNVNRSSIIECELLKLKLAFLEYAPDKRDRIDLSFFQRNRMKLDSDEQLLVSIIETAKNDRFAEQSSFISEQLNQVRSMTLRFEILSVVMNQYKDPELFELLKSLSLVLSKEEKNYYYYEYFYIYYCYFYEPKEIGADERDRFNEVYYFFRRNQRKPAAALIKYKQQLDEKDAHYDIFKSAELVGDYLHWKIPEDFFNSLLNELRGIGPIDLVRLMIYENKNSGAGPLFDFSGSLTQAVNPFKALTREIIDHAFHTLGDQDLSGEEIRQHYKSSEKAFYFYKNTRVILWKISGALFAGLLLAFSGEEYSGYDFNRRHSDLLKKFASLIRRYYEHDYQLHRKLDFIIGESPAVKGLKEEILKVSKVDFSLLIRGESGSGKELVAKAVHLLSSRGGNPFVPVNAAAIPENLLEAELFGYKKGAFTGADESKIGLIEAAHNGSLFLDEIADLPLNLQAKLLRVLQENEIRRLGENKTRTVNIRLICATNKNLKRMIGSGYFRQDLFFRIQDLTVQVPPLRERLEDIPLLVRYFLKKYGFTIPDNEELQRIIAYFKSQSWSGNVRELESAVKRLITYYPKFEMEIGEVAPPTVDAGLVEARENLEKRMILKALQENDWNKVEAATALKITRQYLFNRMRKYGISPWQGNSSLDN
jgi:DNA-binding NtrC family response regulator